MKPRTRRYERAEPARRTSPPAACSHARPAGRRTSSMEISSPPIFGPDSAALSGPAWLYTTAEHQEPTLLPPMLRLCREAGAVSLGHDHLRG